jgi:hypothetical protein
MRIVPASVEVFFRRNFGWRYLPTIMMAFLLCACYASLVPVVLTQLFVFAMLGMSIYHIGVTWARPSGRSPGRYSYSTGDSWPIWRNSGLRPTTVQRYIEPAICVVIAGLITPFDLALSLWVVASGMALFIKEQLGLFRSRRRVLDSVDSRIESQQLNELVTQQLNPRADEAEGFHRARVARPASPRTTHRR